MLWFVQVSCLENTSFCFRKWLLITCSTWLWLPSPTSMAKAKSQALWFPSSSSSAWKVWALSLLAVSFWLFRTTISKNNMPYRFSPQMLFLASSESPSTCGHCGSRLKKAWHLRWQYLLQGIFGPPKASTFHYMFSNQTFTRVILRNMIPEGSKSRCFCSINHTSYMYMYMYSQDWFRHENKIIVANNGLNSQKKKVMKQFLRTFFILWWSAKLLIFIDTFLYSPLSLICV